MFQFTLERGLGSPPRRRGKGGRSVVYWSRKGITPAWAGKRLTRPAMTGTPRDHPRIGGEKVRAMVAAGTFLGSPPHRRGKVRNERNEIMEVRITPA